MGSRGFYRMAFARHVDCWGLLNGGYEDLEGLRRDAVIGVICLWSVRELISSFLVLDQR